MSQPPFEVIRSTRRRKTVSASVVDGTVRVLVPAGMPAAEERQMVEALVAKVTRKMTAGRIDLEDQARRLAGRYGLPRPDSIEWSDRQLSRWGSCTPTNGKVRISNRLAEMPGWVLDYVVVHELAHLAEANHGHRFRELVARYELSERATGYLIAITHMVPGQPG